MVEKSHAIDGASLSWRGGVRSLSCEPWTMTCVGPRPSVLPYWTLTMGRHRAVAHERFEVKGLTTRGEGEVGRCGWPERMHERCQWRNAHGQSTSLVYGNPVPDARLRRIMAILPYARTVSPTMDMPGEMIMAIGLSDQCARRVVGAEVSIRGGVMRISGVDRLVSRGFTW